MNTCPKCEYNMVQYGDGFFCIQCGNKSFTEESKIMVEENEKDNDE